MKKKLQPHVLHGILLVALFSMSAFYIAEFPLFQKLSFSPLIIGIVIGMLYANSLRQHLPKAWVGGILFCTKTLLRWAIVFYGFRLTFQNLLDVGLAGVVTAVLVVGLITTIGYFIGKWMGIDRDIAILTSVGSAVCGAAAVLGMEPVLNSKPYKSAVAVSTVVLFGTTAMFLYPYLFRMGLFDLDPTQMGIFTGGTIHEVAQVVGAGKAISSEVADTAIIVKMIRVMMLAPLLLLFSLMLAKRREVSEDGTVAKSKITIPWFAFGFIAVIGFNSLNLLPANVVGTINSLDTFVLTMAMTALGMETSIAKMKGAGVKPLVLALILFIVLTVGGYFYSKYFLPFLL